VNPLTDKTTATLIEPHGGQLVNLMAPESCYGELNSYAKGLPSIKLSERSLCDLDWTLPLEIA